LRLPTRPKTLAFETYYTCPFDSFFLYELEHEAQAAKPDLTVVQLLDSLAFQEAVIPDRSSNSSAFDFFDTRAVGRSTQYLPNLAWIRAIATTNIPADSTRHLGNELLLMIEEAAHNREKLGDSAFIRSLTSSAVIRSLTSSRIFKHRRHSFFGSQSLINKSSETPLIVAFSDLSTALAREGRVAEAFALANTTPSMLISNKGSASYWAPIYTAITKIRVSEQIMLTDNKGAQPLLNDFLLGYLNDNQAGLVTIDTKKPPTVAANILTVCYWRPTATAPHDTIPLLAQSLTYQLNNQQLITGLFAPFKAYGLADKLNKANQEMADSPFRSGFTLFKDINCILQGYAHLKTTRPGDGWREYDEAALTMPADYVGYSSCDKP
jgi:hypothetical protein